MAGGRRPRERHVLPRGDAPRVVTSVPHLCLGLNKWREVRQFPSSDPLDKSVFFLRLGISRKDLPNFKSHQTLVKDREFRMAPVLSVHGLRRNRCRACRFRRSPGRGSFLRGSEGFIHVPFRSGTGAGRVRDPGAARGDDSSGFAVVRGHASATVSRQAANWSQR